MFLIFKSFFNKFLSVFDFSFEPKVKNLMTAGVQISFILVLFATLIMSIYLTMNQSYIVYEIGSSLFKSFTMFMAIFFISGIAFNTILKEKAKKLYNIINSDKENKTTYFYKKLCCNFKLLEGKLTRY